MKKLMVFLLCVVLLTIYTGANPIIKESVAKQLLRTKRQDRPVKPGYPDEPMRFCRRGSSVRLLFRLRARDTNLEHCLNSHCYPRCDRNYGHPV